MSIIYGSTSIGNEHHILVQLASTMKVMWYNNYQQGTLSWFNKHWQWTLLYWFNKHWATNIIILVQQALAKHQMLACFLTSKVWYPLDGAKICQGADVRIPIKTLAIICLVVLIWFDYCFRIFNALYEGNIGEMMYERATQKIVLGIALFPSAMSRACGMCFV